MINLETGEIEPGATIGLHGNWEISEGEKDPIEESDLVYYFDSFRRRNNPFIKFRELYNLAHSKFHDEKYEESILWAQIGIENFLQNLMILFLEKEGLPEIDITERLERGSVKQVVRAELHTRLGGNWNLESTDSPAASWYHGLYTIRNKIVHRGYFPSQFEARIALTCGSNFISYCLERIKLNRRKFPELYSMFERELNDSA